MQAVHQRRLKSETATKMQQLFFSVFTFFFTGDFLCVSLELYKINVRHVQNGVLHLVNVKNPIFLQYKNLAF